MVTKQMPNKNRAYTALCAVGALFFAYTHTAAQDYKKPFEELFFEGDLQALDTLSLVNTRAIVHNENPIQNLPKKPWTFIVYIAADNDLRAFAVRNIKQMASIGSNEFVNIVVHVDIRIAGNHKITRRYFVDKNKIILINENDPTTQHMDSGNPETLVSCCKWAINSYPADHYALILWNHGTGILDPGHGRIINPSELFSFNPSTSKLELDRSIGFIDLLGYLDKDHRGICWDDSTGNYLTNQKLDKALNTIRTTCLDNKKFDIIAFDACLMSMVEVANVIKPYADIMVSSQEVELGTGWDYYKILAPFTQSAPDPHFFAKHIVEVYAQTYSPITNDYTQSAIDLNGIDMLEENINKVATLLIEGLKHQKYGSVRSAIKASRNKLLCTSFDEPSYIDLYHLYANLQENHAHLELSNREYSKRMQKDLYNLLEEGKEIIKSIVLANAVGKNLRFAHGISIYFPERHIHSSYPKTTFSQNNNWTTLLHHYLNT